MPFIPHTEDDIREMLVKIGVSNIDELFQEIPAELIAKDIAIPEGLSELEVSQLMRERAAQTKNKLCFAGAGCYEHHIPAAVWDVTSRGEFMTAYTPYQAEASQGTLQLIYEFQTMMANLTGMDVANASMYDGASALAEAALMAVRANKKSKAKRILVPKNLHPRYRDVLKTIVQNQAFELIELEYDAATGKTDLAKLDQYHDTDIAAIIIAQPNFFGVIEEVDGLTNWAREHNALSIAVVNPMSLALLKEPGSWGEHGVDIVCGEGQPLGIPMASGGPYFGFMTCKQAYVRQMPGRIVGRTVDTEGKQGFTLTLQAREQHIRRSKATSNICTNQGLLVTAATIYMSIMGFSGLQQTATQSMQAHETLMQTVTKMSGVKKVFSAAHFHETVLQLEHDVDAVLDAMSDEGVLGGYNVGSDYPELGNALLVCTTETKTAENLKQYSNALAKVLEKLSVKKPETV